MIVHTFLGNVMRIILDFANAFDVDLFRFPEFSTVFTLGHRAPFLLYLKERAICVFACRGPVPLDAGFADTASAGSVAAVRGWRVG
jgi:hypothetical protein